MSFWLSCRTYVRSHIQKITEETSTLISAINDGNDVDDEDDDGWQWRNEMSNDDYTGNTFLSNTFLTAFPLFSV